MSVVLFWFRNDLRLHDQPALQAACAGGTRQLLPVWCAPDATERSVWGCERIGPHRRAWLASAVRALERELAALDCPLLVCRGPATLTLPRLANAVGAHSVVCESIAAPEEQAEVEALRAAGLTVHTVWQSSVLDPAHLPWDAGNLPQVFTDFRRAVERARVVPVPPLPAPATLPPWPAPAQIPPDLRLALADWAGAPPAADARSSLPGAAGDGDGGEAAALAHLAQYLARRLPDDYKRTRNGLTGVDYSSKWSPWLATGALSARRALDALRRYEQQHGANEGSEWLWLELLWRDYFRLLHLQHGRRLFGARALGRLPPPAHQPGGFERWCEGATGVPLVDAAMRELRATGYLSNRLRQVVASHLIHALGGDWRAGAAWFESRLVDYDVYSNQGNWLYIAGRGTDPRGGRRFNVDRQAAEHDPQGSYQRRWSVA